MAHLWFEGLAWLEKPDKIWYQQLYSSEYIFETFILKNSNFLWFDFFSFSKHFRKCLDIPFYLL